MRKKYLSVFLLFVLSFVTAVVPLAAFAEGEGRVELNEEALTATISLDDAELEAEAGRLGVPDDQTKRYVVDVKSLNESYQQGLLTRTEYVGAKRELLENLK